MTDRPVPPPYGSAHDLPTYLEMRQSLRVMKGLTRVIGRKHRDDILKLEHEVTALLDLVDAFYERLGGRHWIYTDHLPVSEVRQVLDSTATAEDAEAGLISIIGERVRGPHWQMGLRGHPALRARWSHLERAREHYIAERWDSCTLQLIPVMDGFINDVQPGERRGLHAREPEEMVAWDSLVGHHAGLTSVMPVFTRTFKRRHDDEVFELFRHGIVHGTVTNYSNIVVASKAWNMLAAVVDWAAATKKAEQPPPSEAGWGDTWSSLRRLGTYRSQRDAFEPSEVRRSDPGFDQIEVVRRASAFLDAWAARRWALVVSVLPTLLVGHHKTEGQKAEWAKDMYGRAPLSSHRIDAVRFPALNSAVVAGSATIANRAGSFELRWMREHPDGRLVTQDDDEALWVLAVVPPDTFLTDHSD